MSLITRCIKAGSGTIEWVPDTDILSAEADLDMDTIYDEFNGRITNVNIAPLAGINGSKIASASITATQLAANAVTTPAIADGAVTLPKINAPTGYGTGACITGAAIQTETTLATATLTVTGTRPVLLLPGCSTSVITLADGVLRDVTFSWKRDGTLIGATVQAIQGPFTAGTPTITFPLTPPTLMIDLSPTAGSHSYALTVQCTVATATFVTTPALFAGSITAKELLG